ncbi:hypothetical protein HPB49_022893 [Dermacentor silvarum]|uniref:Uncharacterized protein n=1 Tax=Dermacentor silvarum TaxID=543639 RepID=A0ACB8E400_DERSI|nr:hypothetical protein HPB49_022893 [Dermacentor silvarum]
MQRLLRRRKCLRSQLDDILKEAEGILREQQEPATSQVSVLHDRIDALYLQTAKTDENILNETPDDLIESETLDASKYGDKVVAVTSKLRFELQDIHMSQASRQTSSPTSVSVKSRLPQLELMKFDGNRKQWHRFSTQFSTAVHNKEELSTADQFNYLSTLLSGAAASAISGLQATEECYQDVIDILKKRFGDESMIVQEHLQSLLDLRPVSSSSNITQLRDVYDQVQVHVRSLKAIGTSPSTYCSMLREIRLRVLPSDLVLKFHELYKPTKASTVVSTNEAEVDSEHRMTKAEKELQSLLEYFDHKLQCREAVTPYASATTPEVVQKNRETSRTVQHRNVSSTAALQNVLEKPDLCLFCKSSRHSAEVCDNKEVNLNNKKQIVTKAGRCFRCLKQGSIVHCSSVIVLRTCVEEDTVSEVLSRFWDLESLGVRADEESLLDSELTLQEFEKNVTKRDGRYQVRLPLKKTVDLADNFSVATKRLGNLMRKLSKDQSLLERYDKTIRGYLGEGSAERVSYSSSTSKFRIYYMPHRAVIKEDRTTTKIRIVFEATSHERGAKSLNEHLESGPSLNPDVAALLLHFWRYKVAMTADVEKAFLQIRLHEDRDSL